MIRKTLTYSGFVTAGLVVILAFLTAKTYTQLGIAVFLYPLLAYFTYKRFIGKNMHTPVVTVELPTVKAKKKVEVETAKSYKDSAGVVKDIDKRVFLKLVGAAGVTFFFSSLFGRRSEALLFGGASRPGISALEDNAGKKINPAERHPMDGYRISDIDDGEIAFYGFTNTEGGWFIMKEEVAGSFRYSKGESNFLENWNNRDSLTFDYYHKVF